MKVSIAWLKEWVNPGVSDSVLADELTMAGLEVDGIQTLGQGLSSVVVAEITAIEQHPDADKLQVCQVNDGEEILQIVCGAPNARLGIKIPLAKIGAKLPDGMKIKTAKLRGVKSSGMLCGMDELGFDSQKDDGLWELATDAVVGTSIADYLKLPDTVIELDITPNRSDCFSMAGVAREVGVIFRQSLKPPMMNDVIPSASDNFPVSLQAAEDCPRYMGRVIRDVDVSKPSPLWMQQRLQRAGMRSIDAVVDVTNYVMLELGQPMHAFDLDTLKDGIVVRKATAGEKLVLLDGTELTLNEQSLLIADEEKPLALAGIMGGQHSGISNDTKSLMLEAAFFTPEKIAGRARSFGLHTESSHRFERGVDPQAIQRAMERATQLLLSVVGGRAGPINVQSVSAHIPKAAVITLRRSRIKRLLGFEMANNEITDILHRLGFETVSRGESWQVTVPPRRFDVKMEADLLEELARIYGYNRLPTSTLKTSQSFQASDESKLTLNTLRRQLVGRAYQEIITYSFIEPGLQQQFYGEQAFIKLQNPISNELSAMRTSILPSLIQTLSHNVKRQHTRVRLFEAGQCFIPSDTGEGVDGGVTTEGLVQASYLAGVICGDRWAESWGNDKGAADFFDLKGDVESILSLASDEASIRIVKGEHPVMHPGQCAEVQIGVERGGRVIGHLGALHPRLQSALDLPKNVFIFELQLEALLQGTLPSYRKISKFPEVRRDLAILITEQVSVAEITAQVKAVAGGLMTDFTIFDLYAGSGVPQGEKSLGLGLTLQHHSRTLTDEDVSVTVDQVVAQLQKKFGATLRN